METEAVCFFSDIRKHIWKGLLIDTWLRSMWSSSYCWITISSVLLYLPWWMWLFVSITQEHLDATFILTHQNSFDAFRQLLLVTLIHFYAGSPRFMTVMEFIVEVVAVIVPRPTSPGFPKVPPHKDTPCLTSCPSGSFLSAPPPSPLLTGSVKTQKIISNRQSTWRVEAKE